MQMNEEALIEDVSLIVTLKSFSNQANSGASSLYALYSNSNIW